jgi:hypothetical protein
MVAAYACYASASQFSNATL